MKVTLYWAVPTEGSKDGVVNVKVPDTLAVPPLNDTDDNVCPYVIEVAEGSDVMVGVALVTVRDCVTGVARQTVEPLPA